MTALFNKPRKRRTQTLAEKSATLGAQFVWHSVLGRVFTYAPSLEVHATLTALDGKWVMAAKLNGQKFHGERSTLEDAFKATSNLIYKHARTFWLGMDARSVTKHFDDFLLPS